MTKLIVEILLIVLLFFLERVWRVFRQQRPFSAHNHPLWTITCWVLVAINLGDYWIAYPLIGWVAIGMILAIVQLIGNREFIYSRYWPVFWRLSAGYGILVLIASLFCHNLPLV